MSETWGNSNYSFTLNKDGSGRITRAIKPIEPIDLSPDDILDIYDSIARHYGLQTAYEALGK